MAYGEYANNGRTFGKILFQLSTLGIPLHYVESVIFQYTGVLFYGGTIFAKYQWNEEDVPVFDFSPIYRSFKSIKQDDLYRIHISQDGGKTFIDTDIYFSKKIPWDKMPPGISPLNYKITNKLGEFVNSDLQLINKRIELSKAASSLAAHFNKERRK